MKSKSFVSVVAVLGLLSACGGDDDVVVPAADSVPASALMSAQAFSAYAGSVPSDDRAEPLSLDNVEPPTSETDEPIALN
jgi:hypothetical protein